MEKKNQAVYQFKKLYVYPKLGEFCAFGIRLGGAGLGNSLFILSRAILLAKNHHCALVDPDWVSIKLGPIIRNERDKRLYLYFFNPIGYTGFRKTAIKLLFSKVTEDFFSSHPDQVPEHSVVIVSGLKNYFEDIKYERTFISSFIANHIHRRNLFQIQHFDGNCIGVHIRMGDFHPEWRVPLQWFVSIIEKIRKLLSKNVRVCIFSDGQDEELIPVSKLANVERISYENALIELICLSKCNVILASNSTFSAWAVFLGNKPSVWKYRSNELRNLLCSDTIFEGIVHEYEDIPALLKYNLEQTFCETGQFS
jgi:hypothetical protein